jgi:small subunit ribosomal protein S20
MPVTKSAKKKLNQDKKRTIVNLIIKKNLKEVVKKFLKNPDPTKLKIAFSKIDIASKKNIIHKNKANRIKTRLSKKLVLSSPKKSLSDKKSPKKRSSK